MADRERRELERLAAAGDGEAQAALLLAQVRGGELSLPALRLRAYLGEPAARGALGDEAPGQGPGRWDWTVAGGTFRGDYGSVRVAWNAAAREPRVAWEVQDSNRFASGGLGDEQRPEEFLRRGCSFPDCDAPGSVLAQVQALLLELGFQADSGA